MILYIENELTVTSKVQYDEFDDSILKECNVYFKAIENKDKTITLTIEQQKVVLDEVTMNTLFDEIINCFDYEMTYGNYGGSGCDFSISISQKKDKK